MRMLGGWCFMSLSPPCLSPYQLHKSSQLQSPAGSAAGALGDMSALDYGQFGPVSTGDAPPTVVFANSDPVASGGASI